MFTRAFEMFLYSLAYSVCPFLFILSLLLIYKRLTCHDRKKRTTHKKQQKHDRAEMESLADKAIAFKTPKIETSFGDNRIGDVHSHEEND